MAIREKSVHRVTVAGGAIDIALLLLKLTAGIAGHSAAMIAAAIDSLSDIVADVMLLIFVKLSNKPKDADHDYGHGKYETLASALLAIGMLTAGAMIFYDAAVKIVSAINGTLLPKPGNIAIIVALICIAAKEWAYHFTIKIGRKYNSQAMIANAWQHRTDVLSLLGTAIGIGGAILLGDKWTVLDPIAAVVVAFFILRLAYKILCKAMGELLEQSLPESVENEITAITMEEPGVKDTHNLLTRRIGNGIAIEMHVRMPGNISLYDAHRHATNIEQRLKQRFGNNTHIGLHLEPVKVDGRYVDPDVEVVNN